MKSVTMQVNQEFRVWLCELFIPQYKVYMLEIVDQHV